MAYMHYGGVPDSTLGWSALLPYREWIVSRKSSIQTIIGNFEEMPLAA